MTIAFNIGPHQFKRPVIMGILNVTPDSFSDGGSYISHEQALARVEQMLKEGADIIDVGGESTRPGAADVSLTEELQRTVGVIKAIKQRFDCLVSIDTNKAQVMQQAVEAGSDIINDVCALTNPGALEAAADLGVPVCIMHMQGKPRSMQANPQYDNVVSEVITYLKQRVESCVAAGIDESNIIVDPGFGFGKTLDHNFQLLAQLNEFKQLGLPILAGVSRKSMFGKLLGKSTDSLMAASVAGAVLAAQQGAHIFRVHDVQETADALNVYSKVQMSK
ncbi:dihydropteroate synthase [Agarivorans sp. B2Z047]|uniref:dihydropteroate synthase n=1 Tax=Agarivorans sp. B2Z047 TaxID=2652721 RepID=UPI00128AFD87|nr:dihydropteroate synthase [Agarivorans sp. B2Z047]MPW27758.1 dihydropteroate synthase [Agarivorans sp. B2Z047]UQN44407.1 dihydropteroate synthase [Agarivorans sp. B2Z047]